jgi:hypothetical protein
MGASTSQKAGSMAIGSAKADEVVFWLVSYHHLVSLFGTHQI